MAAAGTWTDKSREARKKERMRSDGFNLVLGESDINE
jgi:hypothetical protein